MSEISFNVSARTARLIGQENFTSAEGAVIELVKNSYDADSTVSIVLIDVFDDCIYIIDNGEGMTSEIIKKHWMTIGTDNKLYMSTTTNSRIKTGAKGIGRFALDRLGAECEMWTKTQKEMGVHWSVNWKQFETEKSITDIKATLAFSPIIFQMRLREILSGFNLQDNFYDNWSSSGTIIKIKYLKDNWKEYVNSNAVLDLQDSLETLIPPLEKDSFRIYLYSTQSKDKFGEILPTELEDFDYKFIAKVDDNQKVEMTIQRNEMVFEQLKNYGFFESSKLPDEVQFKEEAFKNGQFVIHTSLAELLPGQKNNDISDNLSKIGSFTFVFYFLKRGGAQEQREEGLNKFPYRQNINYKERGNWLKRFGGIKIFRDNFRVRPYGEPKSSSFDWLGLGSRTRQGVNPNRGGWKVGASQVYGLIRISRIGNISFEDKSSREGLQENAVFSLFRQAVLKIIEKFERDRTYIIYNLGEIDKVRNDTEKNKQRADEIIEKEEEKQKKGNITMELFDYEDKKTLVDAIKTYKEELEELKEEQKIMRALASSGLVVTSFAHEFSHIRNRIVSRTDDLITILNDVVDEDKRILLDDSDDPYLLIKDIREQDERVKNWLDFALFSVQKSKRNSRKINLNEYINSLERLWSSLLKHLKATIIIDKSKLSMEAPFIGHEIDLDSIFNNLIVNSIDSFTNPKNRGDKREIKLSFVSDANDIHITYEDSGAGLSPDITNNNDIFKAFFTTKRDARTGEEIGTGLGMWIVQTVVESYKGDIKLLHARPEIKFMIKLPYNN